MSTERLVKMRALAAEMTLPETVASLFALFERRDQHFHELAKSKIIADALAGKLPFAPGEQFTSAADEARIVSDDEHLDRVDFRLEDGTPVHIYYQVPKSYSFNPRTPFDILFFVPNQTKPIENGMVELLSTLFSWRKGGENDLAEGKNPFRSWNPNTDQQVRQRYPLDN